MGRSDKRRTNQIQAPGTADPSVCPASNLHHDLRQCAGSGNCADSFGRHAENPGCGGHSERPVHLLCLQRLNAQAGAVTVYAVSCHCPLLLRAPSWRWFPRRSRTGCPRCVRARQHVAFHQAAAPAQGARARRDSAKGEDEFTELARPRTAPGPAWDGSGGAARNVRDQQSPSSGAGFNFGRSDAAPTQRARLFLHGPLGGNWGYPWG